jgi:hypothetical protein
MKVIPIELSKIANEKIPLIRWHLILDNCPITLCNVAVPTVYTSNHTHHILPDGAEVCTSCINTLLRAVSLR